ncbi:MAG: Bacterial alpha-L-rhamnosidase [Planctomycetes bacterium ADurb.Bin126]|nr:MAG: Bacterial alpha-L-rhamnosidase [Planctomycetes bacterium ADurb.Bin126]HOD81187.1 alpha-L-rhamnosidase C-terminal domain-containing protein [Phycisphaerae bacterium]HQL72448.1 alpha-L-rhamnosidase C-terminal domain-containing protein [Phycisphaerae bacterium]
MSPKTLARPLIVAALLCQIAPASAGEPAFVAAKPVWPEGKEKERNVLVEFRAAFDKPAGTLTLRLTGSTLYRVLVNGQFAGHGPARAGHGFYRVDECDLAPRLKDGRNEVTIQVAGYNANSFYLLDQPSFLQAELVAGGRVLAATGGEGFSTLLRLDRVQKVQRYSFQRPFSEVWRLPGPPAQAVRCAVVGEAKPLAPRRVPYSTFDLVRPVAHLRQGDLQKGDLPKRVWKDRSLTQVGPKLIGFPEGELETIPSVELQAVKTLSSRPAGGAFPFTLKSNTHRILDLGTNLTGFVGAKVTARSRTRLFVTFDEILTADDVDFKRLGCVNVVLYELEPGTHVFETFEPYTMRYLKLIVLEGECEVSDLYLRELANPHAGRASFQASDERYNRIFEAARQTFRQNATDVFMDCPSRERAGWLCDSFFTARSAVDFCGELSLEHNMFENFQRPASFAHLPDGMLPMCYPSDHYNGQFIPNWAMWFVVQLEEYAQRGGDKELIDALRPRVLKLLEFFKGFENSDGLLEKLPSWVFVEWSKANSFVQDVNYPSNMLYAATLEAAGRLYGREDLAAKAARVRETVRRQSFDGEFFVDNAVRKGGKLQVTRNRTEVCQYFAFFFRVATPETHARLWRTLAGEFGPQRKQTKAHPEIHPANAFIGNQLRFELLSRDGRNQQILDEAIGYWLYMAERTGTLWEHDAPQASCNHGFASHAARVLIRDVLGLYRVDPAAKTIHLRFGDVKLDWCKGSIPTAAGAVEIQWKKADGKVLYRLAVPQGYKVEVDNRTGCELVKEP